MATSLSSLRASADRLAQLRGEADAELERRNAQIVELVDGGEDRKQIMQAGDVSAVSICKVLADRGW